MLEFRKRFQFLRVFCFEKIQKNQQAENNLKQKRGILTI